MAQITKDTIGATGTPTNLTGSAGANITGSSHHDDHSGPGPHVMAAGDFEDQKVVNTQGEDLGEIEEIMLDVRSGRIAYAVLAAGGFLGMGEKYFAIPWSALTLDTDRKCFILDISKDQLKDAPGFDKDNWPSMADQSWASSVHSYYRSAPYWE